MLFTLFCDIYMIILQHFFFHTVSHSLVFLRKFSKHISFLVSIFTNQFLGITFGTLGCSGNGKVTAQVVTFTNENAEVLARDMAVGQGESLNVLAELMNIQSTDKARFFEVTKANFSQIYAADHNSAQVLASLQQVMANDAVLKAYV